MGGGTTGGRVAGLALDAPAGRLAVISDAGAVALFDVGAALDGPPSEPTRVARPVAALDRADVVGAVWLGGGALLVATRASTTALYNVAS